MSALPKRILVAVDFEHGSRRAIRYARALADAARADVCLLHVLPMAPRAVPTARDRWWMQLALRTLSGLAERAHLKPGTRAEVLAGPEAATIAGFADAERMDLIIIGGRPTPDWHGSLLGPTATAILRHSHVPVLVVPAVAAARAERKSA